MADNARELSTGELRQIREQEGIKLHILVQYSPELNGVADWGTHQRRACQAA